MRSSKHAIEPMNETRKERQTLSGEKVDRRGIGAGE